MGVYIKDMTRDEFSEYGDYCQTLIGTGQAEEVPPHGRLIDADALKPYMLNEHYKHRLVYDANEVAKAPTIVPAEEAPAKDINVPSKTYDLLYEEGGYNSNGV